MVASFRFGGWTPREDASTSPRGTVEGLVHLRVSQVRDAGPEPVCRRLDWGLLPFEEQWYAVSCGGHASEGRRASR